MSKGCHWMNNEPRFTSFSYVSNTDDHIVFVSRPYIDKLTITESSIFLPIKTSSSLTRSSSPAARRMTARGAALSYSRPFTRFSTSSGSRTRIRRTSNRWTRTSASVLSTAGFTTWRRGSGSSTSWRPKRSISRHACGYRSASGCPAARSLHGIALEDGDGELFGASGWALTRAVWRSCWRLMLAKYRITSGSN